MPSPISIIVQSTGIRLDVLPDTTIEMNMGGISLLNLQDRTATYTNTFNLPRTPTNEQQFGFASSPTRSNKVSLAVTISKGLFSRSAILKVDSFDTDYSCTVSYDIDGVIQLLTALNFYELPVDHLKTTIKEDAPEPTADEIFAAVSAVSTDGSLFAPFMYKTIVDPAAMSVASFLQRVTDITGITFSNDVLDATFLGSMIFNKYVTFTYSNTIPDPSGYYFQQHLASGEKDFISCADVLKALSQVFFFDVSISGTVITMTSFATEITGTPVQVDGFTFSKTTTSGYGLTNNINYKVDKSFPDTFAGDVFTSNGEGIKKALEINSFIPVSYSNTVSPNVRGGYDVLDIEAAKDLMIMGAVAIDATASYPFTWAAFSKTSTTASGISGNPLSLLNVYSVPLACLLTPVILDVAGYLDPIQAQNIMTSRLILSRQLQGLYWVDSMAYDLTSGRVKMKLIKLPQ